MNNRIRSLIQRLSRFGYRATPKGGRIDPVCGMEVETTIAQNTLEYEGTVYYFCGKGCRLEFEEDPQHYLDPGYEPSM